MVRHLIDTDRPEAPLDQVFGVGVAPEDLLGPLLELSVQADRPLGVSPMGLQVHVVQDPAHPPRADRWDDAVGDGLAGQFLAGPVSDVQPHGDRLRTGEFDDLRPLEGRISSGYPDRWSGARRPGRPRRS